MVVGFIKMGWSGTRPLTTAAYRGVTESTMLKWWWWEVGQGINDEPSLMFSLDNHQITWRVYNLISLLWPGSKKILVHLICLCKQISLSLPEQQWRQVDCYVLTEAEESQMNKQRRDPLQPVVHFNHCSLLLELHMHAQLRLPSRKLENRQVVKS